MPLNEILTHYPLAFVVTAGVIGLLVGSFLNVLIWRLPKMLEREWRLQAHDILGLPGETPLPTYNLLLRGRCSSCTTPISKRYPLTELACGLLSAFIAWHFGFGWPAGMTLLLTWGLLAMSLIDVEHQLLPDVLVLPLMWLGLIVNSLGLFVPLQDALWGAITGYMALWSVFWLFKLITGKEGMGHGDFKLLAALGAWCGWQYLVTIVLLSSLVGAVLGLGLILFRGRDRQVPMPFGPFLAAAGWLVLLWGAPINRAWLAWLGL